MFELLWGWKTTAVFDVWSIEHFLTGISIGTAVLVHNHRSLGEVFEAAKEKILSAGRLSQLRAKYDIILVLFVAYAWETIEHYLETGLAGDGVAYWFQGVEFWPNRLLADPLMLVVGYWCAKRFPAAVWPARVASLAWLILHIFVFPHSMYLQQWV